MNGASESAGFRSAGARVAIAISFVMLIACEDRATREPQRPFERAGASAGEAQPRAAPGTTRAVDRLGYRDHLAAMWLAQSVANWTGLVTEGVRIAAPFFTDSDWGTQQGNPAIAGTAAGTILFNFLDPWGADDDTDIEFIYVWGMASAGSVHLTPEWIRSLWQEHTEPGQYIWFSNFAAQMQMRASPAVLPPSTSLLAANDQSLMIDAQLTTEVFGALAPGAPAYALEIADLPIAVAASGYAAHAAQFHVALYSLAAIAPAELGSSERIEWLVDTARRLVPETSKTRAVIDLVVEDYLSNLDKQDWERTRDRVARIFQSEAAANGYRYLDFYESSVNLATGVIALLYGGNDLRRTIQIGTLSGWDSDNGTASMAGLLGLLNGTEYVLAAFADEKLSMHYHIGRTRVGFEPDRLTFTEIADRMLPLVEQAIVESGGTVDRARGLYMVPSNVAQLDPALDNPRLREHLSSVNNSVEAAPKVSVEGGIAEHPDGAGVASDEALVDGLELDGSGRDRGLAVRNGIEFQSVAAQARCIARTGEDVITVSVTWAEAAHIDGVRWVEGSSSVAGGWTELVAVEVRAAGSWEEVVLRSDYDPGREQAFEIHTLRFAEAVTADGVRVRARSGGSSGYLTLCELDGVRTARY